MPCLSVTYLQLTVLQNICSWRDCLLRKSQTLTGPRGPNRSCTRIHRCSSKLPSLFQTYLVLLGYLAVSRTPDQPVTAEMWMCTAGSCCCCQMGVYRGVSEGETEASRSESYC